jgi:hypothetical protein
MRVCVSKNNNKMFDGQYLRAKKNMSAFDVVVQPEHVTDKEYIGTLLAQIKDQQETYNDLYNRNLWLYNELKFMDAYAMQLTEAVTKANQIIASGRQANASNDGRQANDSNDGNTHSSSQ